MKRIIIALLFALPLVSAGQDLIKTSAPVIYRVNPIDSATVVQILESVQIDFIADKVTTRILTCHEAQIGDTTVYRVIERNTQSRVLSQVAINQQVATLIGSLKQIALGLALQESNVGSKFNHGSWVTGTIEHEIVR